MEDDRWMPSRLIYSVFRSQGTCAGNGVEAPDWAPFVYGVTEAAGSSKRKLSLGSSTGRSLGSGFNADEDVYQVPTRDEGFKWFAYQNRQRQAPRATRNCSNPKAFRTLHPQSWAAGYHLLLHRETLAAHSALGLFEFREVLEDMAVPEVDWSTELEPGDLIC